jgi:hypothetical protein
MATQHATADRADALFREPSIDPRSKAAIHRWAEHLGVDYRVLRGAMQVAGNEVREIRRYLAHVPRV